MNHGPTDRRGGGRRRIGRRRGAALALAFAAGCSPAHYRESADEEVYGILAEKQQAAVGRSGPFTIEPPAGGILRSLPADETGKVKLSLASALAVALENSRQYQSQKESLYLAMLTLTGVRHRYAPNFFATLAGTISGNKTASEGSASGSGGLNQLFTSGARTTLSLATSVFRSFTSNPADAASSVLSLSFVQPLLRGAGARVAAEALTQGERDAIYSVRTFERYRQTFSVSIANQFYQALASRDAVVNAANNLGSLRLSRERSEYMARAGRLPDFQVDQSRSSEFQAEDSYVRAQRSYEDALDQFKLTLGIPTDFPLVLDEQELSRIGEAGLQIVEMELDEAIRLALESRLDLANSRDAVADAERKVEVARNDLLPGLDLSGRVNIPTQDKRPAQFRFDHFT
ncbi:MAG: TolC family protein, partial [Planctomycetes bacterium]|nr:TolC family protein [Planctomycetota bacterium]